MLISYIDQLLGSVPSGYEPLRYLIAGIVLIFLLSLVYNFLRSLFGGWAK